MVSHHTVLLFPEHKNKGGEGLVSILHADQRDWVEGMPGNKGMHLCDMGY